jgi:hypothetical protein
VIDFSATCFAQIVGPRPAALAALVAESAGPCFRGRCSDFIAESKKKLLMRQIVACMRNEMRMTRICTPKRSWA